MGSYDVDLIKDLTDLIFLRIRMLQVIHKSYILKEAPPFTG
jgi:hypothetical protein